VINKNNMNSLIIDAANDKFFLSLIVNKNIYTRSYDNSKNNFEKLVILINEFLDKNKTQIDNINKIYVNRGPGSYGAIRNSMSVTKGFHLSKNIDYYCFSFQDFGKLDNIKYKELPNLCEKFKIKKNLIKPLYLS